MLLICRLLIVRRLFIRSLDVDNSLGVDSSAVGYLPVVDSLAVGYLLLR